MRLLKLITIMILMMIASIAFGQEVPPEQLPPEWVGAILLWLKSIPTVGPYIVIALKWIATIGTVFTVLATAASTILKLPEIIARVSGAEALADKIKAFHDKVMPWLRYLSIYNQQKAQPK